MKYLGRSLVIVWVFLLFENSAAASPCSPLTWKDIHKKASTLVDNFQQIQRKKLEYKDSLDRLQQSRAAFDPTLQIEGGSYFEEYYSGARSSLSVQKQNRFLGSQIETGIRRGAGSFPIYEDSYETSSGGEFFTEIRIPLLRNLKIDDSRFLEEQADVESDIAKLKIENEKNSILKDFLVTVHKIWVAKRNVHSLTDLAENIEHQRTLLSESIREGAAPKNDLLELERFQLKNKSALQSEKNKLRKTLGYLNTVYFGEHPTDGLDACHFQRVALHTFAKIRKFPVHLPLDFEKRPDIVVLNKERQLAERMYLLAKNKTLPKLDLKLAYEDGLGSGHPSDTQDSVKGLLQFSYPIFNRAAESERNIKERGLRKIDLTTQQLKNRLEAMHFSLLEDLKNVHLQHSILEREIELLHKLLEADRFSYRAGTVDLFQINQRQGILIELELLLASYFSSYLDTYVELALLTNDRGALSKFYRSVLSF